MAQTTDGFYKGQGDFEVSTNGSTWTDISGWVTNVDHADGNRESSETKTLDGDTPFVLGGKRNGERFTVSIVFTEGASDAWTTVRDEFTANNGIHVRWAPKGNTTGNLLFSSADTAGTAAKAVIEQCPIPSADATSADPSMVDMVFFAAQFIESTVA